MAPYDGPPVVVIGNGPVGQTTALLLARWGIPVLVLDAHAERDIVGSRSICQQRDVIDVWDSVGVGRKVAKEGVTWQVARTYFRDKELFNVEFSDAGRSPWPPWVNIPQHRVEQILDERIAEVEEIEVLWGHRVTGLHQNEDHVVVEVDTPDGSTWIDTPYVVACAGARGDAVREPLGLELAGQTYPDQFLICDIKADMSTRARERSFHFDPDWNPGRQVLIHPCPDSTYRIDWQVEPEFDLEAEEADGRLEERIRKVIGDRDYELVWRTVYRFHSRCVDQMAVGRVLLAGDCAHLMAPFGARGLNSGVGDAENAAWKIAFVLNGWAGKSLIATYGNERLAAAHENLEITNRTMDFLVPQTEEGRAHRQDVLERAVQDPDARTEIDSGRLYSPFRYGHSPHPEVGRMLPDLPYGATRLREMARQGLLVMLTDEADREVAETVLEEYDVPARIVTMPEDTAEELGMQHWEAWLVRPDAHVHSVADTDNLRRLVPQLLHLPA